LYVGGAGVSRGYLKRPELTQERFIPHLFGSEPGTRLYKTGDRVRHLSDGGIEYLGRLDQQVKLRGFRIELGEIEAALGQHPAVREAVVIARQERPGDTRLVAYVVPAEATVPAPRAWRAFLKQTLPDYMIPTAFVVIEAVPLTANGKVDRLALPAPASVPSALEEAFVPPQTPAEHTLAQLWAAVLGLERVGRHDNFFELGGHSLMITQVMSRVQDAFQVELPLRSLFDHPTVAELAQTIEHSQITQSTSYEILEALASLKHLSDDEVRTLLADEGSAS
jgi:acyl carrier protein